MPVVYLWRRVWAAFGLAGPWSGFRDPHLSATQAAN